MPEGPRLWPGESTAQAFQGRHMGAPGAGGRACPRRCVVHEHARPPALTSAKTPASKISMMSVTHGETGGISSDALPPHITTARSSAERS